MITWDSLIQSCRTCQKCALADTRSKVVVGSGAIDAKVLVIGDVAPLEDTLTYSAFSGKTGLLLDQLLSIIDLERSQNIYTTYRVKCVPPHGRAPFSSESRTCLSLLRQEVQLTHAKMIICLGEAVSSNLIHPKFDLTLEHGVFYEKARVHMVGLYDLNTLERNPQLKPETFGDLMKIKEKLLEISPETYQ